MLKWYGFFGLLLMMFGVSIPVLNINPFIVWYFPILWYGYIFFLDSINLKIRGMSLLTNKPKEFFIMLLPYWFIFEFFNLFTKNWHFVNFPLAPLFLACTILPAYFETDGIISHFFKKKISYKIKFKLSKNLLSIILTLGFVFSLMTILYPKQFFWSFWIGLFFIFDSINHHHRQPSILSYLLNNKLKQIITFSISGLLIGVLFEIFNSLSTTRWIYNIPIYLGPNVFGLPVFAYFGYIMFTLDLFALYYFVKSMFLK